VSDGGPGAEIMLGGLKCQYMLQEPTLILQRPSRPCQSPPVHSTTKQFKSIFWRTLHWVSFERLGLSRSLSFSTPFTRTHIELSFLLLNTKEDILKKVLTVFIYIMKASGVQNNTEPQ